MFPILFGLVAAMLFGLSAFAVYGLEGLTQYQWIDMVFWGLIASGALVSLVGESLSCWVCAVKQRFRFSGEGCRGAIPCAQ